MKAPQTPLQWTYLTLSLVGMVVTWYFNILFMMERGGVFSVVDFVAGGYANLASTSLSNDILVAGNTFFVWSFVEARRLNIRGWWFFFVITWVLAFAVAFPLFLFIREQKLAEARSSNFEPTSQACNGLPAA